VPSPDQGPFPPEWLRRRRRWFPELLDVAANLRADPHAQQALAAHCHAAQFAVRATRSQRPHSHTLRPIANMLGASTTRPTATWSSCAVPLVIGESGWRVLLGGPYCAMTPSHTVPGPGCSPDARQSRLFTLNFTEICKLMIYCHIFLLACCVHAFLTEANALVLCEVNRRTWITGVGRFAVPAL